MLQGWWQWRLQWTLIIIFVRDDTFNIKQNHRRWPGNLNGWSKFRKYRAYKRLQQMVNGWRRLLAIVQMARSWHQKHRWRWPGHPKDRSKFHNYQNLCLWDHARPQEKHLFAARPPPLWCHCTLFFSAIISLLFSPTKNNFLTTFIPMEKPRYTYWRIFL